MPGRKTTRSAPAARAEASGRRACERKTGGSAADAPFSARSEDYLRCLIATIPDMVWLKDPQGAYLSCNQAFEQLYDVREADLLGRTDYDFTDRESADTFRRNDRMAMETGRPKIDEEWVTMAATGQLRLVETIKTPMHDAGGDLIGVLGIARDITERKRTEQALEKRMLALTQPLDDAESLAFDDLFDLEDIQRFQDQFARATGVASLITTPDGAPITRPSNFCRLCNDIIRNTEKGRANCRKSDAFLGRHDPGGPLVHPCLGVGMLDAGAAITVGGRHLANWLIGQVREEAQTEETVRAYARVIGTDEDEAAAAFAEVPAMSRERFEDVAQALFTLANKLSDFAYQNVQQARFIHERKRVEQELLHLQSDLADIIDSMPSAIVGVDGDGNVTHWNSRVERESGILSEDAAGRPLAEVLPGLGEDAALVDEAMRTRQARTVARRTVDESGEVRHENVTVYPLLGEGGRGAVVRIDDVTDKVALEQLMVQTEKMMSVGGLAAGMAHEINNPLAGILQSAQNIERRLSPGLAANAAAAREAGISIRDMRRYMEARGILKMLDGIQASGRRASQIVRNMLDFSRKSDLNPCSCDLNALLDAALDIAASDYDLKKKYDFKRIEIVRDYDPGIGLVSCIPTELEQVFLNLLKNAAHAMAERKADGVRDRIAVRTRRIGDKAVVEIKDNGPGMDEETRKQIFDPFYTTKAPGVGTGLGLSVSYFIIAQNHGGAISVESSPGAGATFTVMLPQDPACTEAADQG